MKILLGTFKEKGEELATFLEPRIGAKPEFAGSEMTIDDAKLRKGVRSRQVKTYIKRFLHKQGERKNYRVMVQASELRLVELEGEEEEEEEKKEGKKETKQEEKVEEKPEKKEEPKQPEPTKDEEEKEPEPEKPSKKGKKGKKPPE